MNTRLASLLIAAFLPWQGAQAQTQLPPLTADQRDNLAAVYARCGAYFTYVWKGLARSGESDYANMHHEFAKKAMAISYELALANRTPEMAQKVVEARYQISIEIMGADIGDNFSNISVIVSKYGKNCALAVTDASAFARQYIKEQN